jgi:hypothetical protein
MIDATCLFGEGNRCRSGLVENVTIICGECVSRRAQSQIPAETMRISSLHCGNQHKWCSPTRKRPGKRPRRVVWIPCRRFDQTLRLVGEWMLQWIKKGVFCQIFGQLLRRVLREQFTSWYRGANAAAGAVQRILHSVHLTARKHDHG